MKLKVVLAAAASLVTTHALAAEFSVRGVGSVTIKGNKPETVRAMATREAKRKAVIAAIDKILGANASASPAVAAKIDAIVQQVNDGAVVESSSQAVGGAFEVSLSLALDDKIFRELLSDQGVALNTSTGRSYSILAVMDEYRTTPKNLRAPVEELVEFSAQRGASFSDKSAAGASANSASNRAGRSSSSLDARETASGSASGRSSGSLVASRADQEGSGSFNVRANDQFSVRENGASSLQGSSTSVSTSASASASSSFAKMNVQAEDHDDVAYRKLVKYQPQSTAPETMNRTYGALVGQLQSYDLRIIDNDLFRSRYFKDKPLTLDRIVNSAELARYIQLAKSEAKADFFLAGTSVIVDSGVSPTTGQTVCSGVVTVKAYSTVDGETIASETIPETSSGLNSDDCAGAVARKMAVSIGPRVGAQVQNYWKRRSMYGREVVLTLRGTLPLALRARFASAVAALPGVESSVQRSASGSQMEFTVSYKGGAPIDQALATLLANDPAFSNLDSRSESGRVLMCLGACPAPGA